MSFVDKLKGFVEASRAGFFLGLLIKEIRKQLDGDGNGKVEPAEVLEALPTDILLKYGGEFISKVVPLLVPIVKLVQAEVAKRNKV